MNDVPARFGQSNGGNDPSSPNHSSDEWAEVLARTVAHLAAQLTMTQIRLRALASELSTRDPGIDAAVQTRLQMLAITETGRYLRENLGDALVDLIDIDALEREIIEFLSSTSSD
jgi:hypothetical protein